MKKLAGSLIVLLVLLIGVGAASHRLIDQKAIGRKVVDVVREQTGAELAIERTTFQLLPWPSLHAENVVLSKPGCSSPLLVARSVHAGLSLLALLHREIRFQDFAVDGASFTLKREAAQACHVASLFAPAPPPVLTQTGGRRLRTNWRISFDSLHLTDASFNWRDQANGQSGEILIQLLDLAGLRSDSPWINLQARHDKTPFTLKGRIGALALLRDPVRPWAFSLGLTMGDGSKNDRLTLDGFLRDAAHLRGLSLSLRGDWADFRTLRGIFPHADLPDMRGLGGMIALNEKETASVAPGASWPETLRSLVAALYPVQMHLHIAHIVLPREGMAFGNVQLDADARSAPLAAAGEVDWGQYHWQVHAGFESLEKAVAAWRDPARPSVGATVEIRGRDPSVSDIIGRMKRESAALQQGLRLRLSGTVGLGSSQLTLQGSAQNVQLPLLSAEGRAASGKELHNLALRGMIVTTALSRLQVEKFSLQSREFAADGALNVFYTGGEAQPLLVGRLHVTHGDLDNFRLWPPTLPDEDEVSSVTDQNPAPTRRPSPFASWTRRLTAQDVDLHLTADQLLVQGVEYRNAQLHLVLLGGRLLLEPLTGQVGKTPFSARIDLDAAHPLWSLDVKMEPMILPAGLVFSSLGLPPVIEGSGQLVGSFSAKGADPVGMRRSLNGHLGFSVVGGSVQGSVLSPLAGPASPLLRLEEDNHPLRCFGVHARFARDQAAIDLLGLQSKQFIVQGMGSLALRDGDTVLHLRPRLALGGQDISTPVLIKGIPPALQVTQEQDGQGRFQLDLGQKPSSDDPCAAFLQAAREGRDGELPPSAPAPHSRTEDMLRALGVLR